MHISLEYALILIQLRGMIRIVLLLHINIGLSLHLAPLLLILPPPLLPHHPLPLSRRYLLALDHLRVRENINLADVALKLLCGASALYGQAAGVLQYGVLVAFVLVVWVLLHRLDCGLVGAFWQF